jgi:hypothetical protein
MISQMPCGCVIERSYDWIERDHDISIKFCPTHEAAGQLAQHARQMAKIVLSADTSAVTLEEAILVLRQFEANLDRYGELHIGTIQEFRALMAKLDGDPVEPPADQPF